MATSPSHTLGQFIGDRLEESLYEPLSVVSTDFQLYLDYKHARTARSGRRKVAWEDGLGNIHDLDYVLEAEGTDAVYGSPKAFIESAWRRYTKHSRNKAQEIQGAIIPLAEKYHESSPFLGVVLGGEFTQGALDQFASHGFSVLHCPYETMMSAFDMAGLDLRTQENSPTEELAQKAQQCQELGPEKLSLISKSIREVHAESFNFFLEQLRKSLSRVITQIHLLGLFGQMSDFGNIPEALSFLEGFDERSPKGNLMKFEIIVRYSNGDELRASFGSKKDAMSFLKSQ